jgi:hypothetical protein
VVKHVQVTEEQCNCLQLDAMTRVSLHKGHMERTASSAFAGGSLSLPSLSAAVCSRYGGNLLHPKLSELLRVDLLLSAMLGGEYVCDV